MKSICPIIFATVLFSTIAFANNAIGHSTSTSSRDGAPSENVVDTAIEDNGPAEHDEKEPCTQDLVRDPWESLNRKVHGFNNTADEYILRPAAVGYKAIVPQSVQVSVSRFFANMGIPATAVNQALQGRPVDAAISLERFAINTTVGIGGVFDPATYLGIPEQDGEDFGQTLAAWGWRDSSYMVLPLLGPRTVRDTVGIVGDQPLSPVGYVADTDTASGLQVLEVVDVRTRMLQIDALRQEALDDYLFVRSAWIQQRNHQIQQDQRENDG